MVVVSQTEAASVSPDPANQNFVVHWALQFELKLGQSCTEVTESCCGYSAAPCGVRNVRSVDRRCQLCWTEAWKW